MRKWMYIALLILCFCLSAVSLAGAEGITILSPNDGAVLDPAEEIVRFSFRVPEGNAEDAFTYILTDVATDEVMDVDEIYVDPDDLTETFGFDMAMFEPGNEYKIQVTAVTDISLDTSVLFKISESSEPADGQKATRTAPAVHQETVEEGDYAIMLISPEDGAIVDPQESSEIVFRWILDEYPVNEIPYTWAIQTEAGEDMLSGSGRMNGTKKQYEFAVPASLFEPDSPLRFVISAQGDEITSDFKMASRPEPTPTPVPKATPVVTPTPEPQKTQEQLIAAAASQLGLPKDYISKVRMSGDSAYPFSAVLEGGTVSGDSNLRIITPSNGSVMSFNENLFFEVNLEALKPIDEKLVIVFSDVVGDNVLYILYYEKPIEEGKTVALAVPCRYFTPDSLVRLIISSTDSDHISSTTLFSFRKFQPTPAPTAKPTPEPAAEPAPETEKKAESVPAFEPAQTLDLTPEPTKESTPEPTPEPTPAPAAEKTAVPATDQTPPPTPSIPVEEVEGRIRTQKDGVVNVRQLPDPKSPRLATVNPNTILRFTGIAENGWYRVVLKNGTIGYISGKLCRRLRN